MEDADPEANINSLVDIISLDSDSTVVIINVCNFIWTHFGCRHLVMNFVLVAYYINLIAYGVFMCYLIKNITEQKL